MTLLKVRPVKWMERHPAVTAGFILLIADLLFLSAVLVPPSGQAVGSFDTRGLFYPWLDRVHQSIWNGVIPFWDSQQFAGYPFLSNPQVALFYPPTWLAILLPVNVGLSWYVALHVWWAAFGMWLFARQRGASRSGAYLAALAFGFSGFVAARIWAGHIGLLATNSWIPWLLLIFSWSVKRRGLLAGFVTGIPLGLTILAGHTSSLLYVILIWFAYAIFLGVSGHEIRLVAGQFVVAVCTGLVISAVQLLPMIQFGLVSTRASLVTLESASAFSFPPAHLITLLIPEFFGEPTRAGYWSVPNFEELSYYAGILPMLALMLGLRRPSRSTWFFVGLMAVGLLLAFGSYGFLFPMAYKLLPLFRLTRAPARAAVLFSFAVSALLAESSCLKEVQGSAKQTGKTRRFLTGLQIVFAVLGLTALAATGAVFATQHPSGTSGRLWHQIGGWATALVIALIELGLLKGYLSWVNRRRLLTAGLILVSLADLWLFGFKLIRLESMDPSQMWVDAKTILGDTPGRVLPWGISIFEQNGAGQVGLTSVFGYNALEVGANTAFAASVPDPRSTAFDILGASAVVSQVPLDHYGDGERPLNLIDHTEQAWVYGRGRVLPLARLAYGAEIIEDSGGATSRVHEAGFDPETTVILERAPDCGLPAEPAAGGTAEIVEQRDGFWRIETNSLTPALLVLSETAYPGWRATVSGTEAEIYTAYTTIRAVCVPAGKQEVVWKYQPTVYVVGGALSLLALVLVGLAAVVLGREARLGA